MQPSAAAALPTELMQQIFLEAGPEATAQASQVCRHWRNAAGDFVWRELYRERYATDATRTRVRAPQDMPWSLWFGAHAKQDRLTQSFQQHRALAVVPRTPHLLSTVPEVAKASLTLGGLSALAVLSAPGALMGIPVGACVTAAGCAVAVGGLATGTVFVGLGLTVGAFASPILVPAGFALGAAGCLTGGWLVCQGMCVIGWVPLNALSALGAGATLAGASVTTGCAAAVWAGWEVARSPLKVVRWRQAKSQAHAHALLADQAGIQALQNSRRVRDLSALWTQGGVP